MVGMDAGCQHGGVPGSWELLTAIPLGLGADSTARKEREVMLRLKEVVDKQRDEIRAQAHEIVCKSRDTEAVSAGELEDVKGLGTCFPVPSPGPVSQACRGRCLSHAVQALVALVAAERCCCGSLGAAVGFPAPGAAAALHVHERGPAAQGSRGAGAAQERAGEEVGPGGRRGANPEGDEQEEQGCRRGTAAEAQHGELAPAGDSEWPRRGCHLPRVAVGGESRALGSASPCSPSPSPRKERRCLTRSPSPGMRAGAPLTAASPRKSCSRSCRSGTSSRPTCSWCRRSWPITSGEPFPGGTGNRAGCLLSP